jgi:hypothetical protein
MTFLTELATNATQHGVHIVLYVGNDDAISPHFGTEGQLSLLSNELPTQLACCSHYSGRIFTSTDASPFQRPNNVTEHYVWRHTGVH